MGSGSLKSALFSLALFLLPLFLTVSGQSSSPPCAYNSFSNKQQYRACVTLPHLGCYLHWRYNAAAGTADIAFRATGVTPSSSSSGNWVAWALNPSDGRMVGAQTLVAYKNASGGMRAYTSDVKSDDSSTQLTESSLSFDVTGLSAESSGSQIIIYATVKLPKNQTTIQQVWQVGPLSGGIPVSHSLDNTHLSTTEIIDFSTGVTSSEGLLSQLDKKNIHGVLNVVSWGIMMPIGGIVARYLKVFKSADPAWFYFHVSCQCIAYIIGVIGWGSGLDLGGDSNGTIHLSHRYIGIALFCLATLQVFALLIRPKKDHKYRMCWNLYHWGVGYTVIILSIINIYKGLDILDPGQAWQTAYTGVIVVLGAISVFLEATTWVIVLRRKKDEREPKHGYNGYNGIDGNGYTMRSQP